MVRRSLGDPRTAWRGTLAGLGAALLVAGLFASGLLAGPYAALQDLLFPRPLPGTQVTLIAIDQPSQDKLIQHSWPYTNDYHAQVLEKLTLLHPKVILFDVVPALPSNPPSADDLRLAKAIHDAGNVVMVCTADDPPSTRRSDFSIFFGQAAAVGDRSLGLPDAANAVRSVPLQPAASCPANSDRRAAFVKALDLAGFDTAQIPTQPDGQMLINFTDGKGAITCPYAVAYAGNCSPGAITNRIVVVGIKVLNADDVHSQAVAFDHTGGNFCPAHQPNTCMQPNQNYGYRIMGDEITTVLGGRYLRLQPDLSVVLGLLLLGALVGTLLYVLPIRTGLLVAALGLAAYLLGVLLLARAGYLSDPLFAPIAMVLAGAAGLVGRYLLEERERRKVEALFGQYVDPRIIARLVRLKSAADLRLGGERRELTLLFCDIRGFTAMSESLAAEDVVRLTTEYLTALTEVVLKWDGTIDKYVGDEIVAAWNTPYEQADHALLAVRCAYDLVSLGGTLQERLLKGGLPPVRYGIGINTGQAVWGNMGSPMRQQFTALGDAVNTASRLCSAAGPFELLLSEATYQQCRDYVAVELKPGVELKGKSMETLRVYRVVAVRERPDTPWVAFPTEIALQQSYANAGLYQKTLELASKA